MTTLAQLDQHCAVDLQIVADTVERLRAGITFVDLLEDKIDIRAASLSAVLEQVANDDLKLVWAGNPLRSPLTIERLMLQAAGPEADLRFERTPQQLANMLTLSPDATALLVIVQQPETLDPIARETLAHMQPYLATAVPRVQILFCGTSAFHPIETVAPPRTDIALRDPLPEAPAASRREVVPLLLLLIATATGSFWATPITSPRAPEALRAAAAPSQPAPQPAIDMAALRREFDKFLAEQPDRVSTLTPGQRDALFDEYLQRTRRIPPSASPALPGKQPG